MRWPLLGFVTVVVSLLACTGTTAPTPTPVSGGATTDGGSGGTGSSSACPDAAPNDQDNCTVGANVVCEFGNDPRPACRIRATCVYSNGDTFHTWQVVQVSDPSCTPATGSCPASQPQSCTTCSAPAACAFGSQTCICRDPNAPCNQAWSCSAKPASPCPTYSPNLGTACTGTATCDYGVCSKLNGDADARRVTCSGGIWTEVTSNCP
jgi:hypothetical protein